MSDGSLCGINAAYGVIHGADSIVLLLPDRLTAHPDSSPGRSMCQVNLRSEKMCERRPLMAEGVDGLDVL
jgi:hypothetical protein